jgi:hypothetical protein
MREELLVHWLYAVAIWGLCFAFWSKGREK